MFGIIVDPQFSLKYLMNLYKKTYKNKFVHLLIRKMLIRKYDVHLGYDTLYGENLKFSHPSSIVIGEGVKIGNDCQIYQGVTLGIGKNEQYPIIKNNVTIYANSTIIGGVTIGNNTVIGANSLVLHDVPDNSIFAGNPALKIGEISNDK